MNPGRGGKTEGRGRYKYVKEESKDEIFGFWFRLFFPCAQHAHV